MHACLDTVRRVFKEMRMCLHRQTFERRDADVHRCMGVCVRGGTGVSCCPVAISTEICKPALSPASQDEPASLVIHFSRFDLLAPKNEPFFCTFFPPNFCFSNLRVKDRRTHGKRKVREEETERERDKGADGVDEKESTVPCETGKNKLF